MRIIALRGSVLFLSCCAASVWAAVQMKPGLWEMTVKSDAIKDVPKISPEQLQKMKEMGINVPDMRGGQMVSKICFTREQSENGDMVGVEEEEGCQTRNYRKSSTGYSADVVCNGDQMQGEGTLKGILQGNDRFTSTYDFKGTVNGRPVNQHYESSGKWLGADCGPVKP